MAEEEPEVVKEVLTGTPFVKFNNVVPSSETDKTDDKIPSTAEYLNYDKPIMLPEIGEKLGDGPQTRARVIEIGETREHKKITFNDKYDGPWFDCRDDDYDCIPNMYEKCTFPEIDHFDTAEYQAQSAYCKLEQLWRKTISDTGVRERFYTGNEF